MSSRKLESVRKRVESHVEPLMGVSLLDAGVLREITLERGRALIRLELGFPAAGYQETLKQSLDRLLQQEFQLAAEVDISWKIHGRELRQGLEPVPNISNIIAVASGKGGVGKSTVAVNLALALQAEGASVGVLDADIYGPSQPRMLGTTAKPTSPDGKVMLPIKALGLQAMSIGFLISEDQPMIWRGPMATQALMQLIGETRWEPMDYLIVDLPPGTGDIQLTLSQRIPVSGAIVVTTPQDIALIDARKGLQMFRKVDVPILGLVENMSYFACPHCGERSEIFGTGGGQHMSDQYGVELIAQVPLDAQIRHLADSGNPTVAADPDSPAALIYRDMARRAAARLAHGTADDEFPDIEVSDD